MESRRDKSQNVTLNNYELTKDHTNMIKAVLKCFLSSTKKHVVRTMYICAIQRFKVDARLATSMFKLNMKKIKRIGTKLVLGCVAKTANKQ